VLSPFEGGVPDLAAFARKLVERFQNSNHMRPSKRQHFADQDAKLQRISFMESMV
jgi:hypothetical protein